MEPDSLLATLEVAGVVESPQDGSTVRLAESFTTAVAVRRESLADLDDELITSRVETEVTGEHHPLLGVVSHAEPSFVARCLALASHTPELAGEEIVRTAVVLDQFADRAPLSDGAPERFLPICGDRIEIAVALSRFAIVYVWREECPPCDVMCREFESRFTKQPEDIALYAVYGPGWSELLSERYDVGGGPTTLFFADAAVDARLVGAHYGATIGHEIEQLRETRAG